jgi:glycosyltransferase involved in cell wall biosynthesis
MSPPVFAMVSTDIRRDLILPLRALTRLRLIHFYRQAPYGDLAPEDLDQTLVHYTSPLDLYRRLERAQPQIVQNVELLAIRQLPYAAAITLYARRHGIPLVAGVHISLPAEVRFGRLPAYLLRLLLAPLIRSTSLFFYLNEGGRRNLEWLGAPAGKMKRLMYGTWGIDPREFTPERDGREPDWGPSPVLLFVGRITPEKGIPDLLQAYALVQATQPGTKLILIGDGPITSAYEASVRGQSWSEGVRFLGTIPNRDLPPYFRAAALFLSPSMSTGRWEEYVGMTNLQAMACGLPVVSTRSGAIPEYVPASAGLLVSERDPQALAEAVLELLSDPTRRKQMGEAGRAHAVEFYDARRSVLRAEEELLCLLDGHRTR